MKPHRYFAEAEAELTDALLASADAAALRAAAETAIRDIASGLTAYPLVSRSQCRCCVLPKPYPYSIIYIETDTEVLIIAFPHHKQRPGYWKNRLPKKP